MLGGPVRISFQWVSQLYTSPDSCGTDGCWLDGDIGFSGLLPLLPMPPYLALSLSLSLSLLTYAGSAPSY